MIQPPGFASNAQLRLRHCFRTHDMERTWSPHEHRVANRRRSEVSVQ